MPLSSLSLPQHFRTTPGAIIPRWNFHPTRTSFPPCPCQVLDVFTAIALSHVLRRLLQAGVVVVATSNKPLHDLNKVRGAHGGSLRTVGFSVCDGLNHAEVESMLWRASVNLAVSILCAPEPDSAVSVSKTCSECVALLCMQFVRRLCVEDFLNLDAF